MLSTFTFVQIEVQLSLFKFHRRQHSIQESKDFNFNKKGIGMRNLKTDETKIWTTQDVEKLLDHISVSKGNDPGAIHTFVNKKLWKKLEYPSLAACVKDNPDLPSSGNLGRIAKSVAFHKNYLPELGEDFLKESAIRPICGSNYSEAVKKRVASKIINSQNPSSLHVSDIERFITQSFIVLKPSQKREAKTIATELITDDVLSNMMIYFKKSKFKTLRRNEFIRQLSAEVANCIKNQL